MSNMPQGDIWAMKIESKNSLNYGRNIVFDFTGISRKDLLELMKSYVWHEYRADNMDLYVLVKRIREVKKCFYPFMVIYKIQTLKELTERSMEDFRTYLNTMLTEKGKTYSASSIQGFYGATRTLLKYGQLYCRHLLPEKDLFLDDKQMKRNRKVRIEYIPDYVMSQINDEVKKEENVYLKNAIIILKFTGMRMGELCSLKTDCVEKHLINGFTMRWMDFKNRKERQPVPVRQECAIAVKEIQKYTEEMRSETDEEISEYLFIRKTAYGISKISPGVMGAWIRAFTTEHEIRDENGEIYHLTSHQFRRTLATDMISNGVNLSVIQQMLGHANAVTTTKYYADVKDSERIRMFHKIGIIGNIRSVDESIISDSEELEWFRRNMDTAAKMCDGYCTKPVKNGQICERLLKKHKCLTCKRFITTPEYLEVHKNHLKALETDLDNNTFGEHYAAHLIPGIEALREIIERLEEIKDGDN